MMKLIPGPYLVLDRRLVEHTEHLKQTYHQPLRHPEPIQGKAEEWHTHPSFYIKVIHYPPEGRFRMWYYLQNYGIPRPPWLKKFDPIRIDQSGALAYAESEDGIHWVRPRLRRHWWGNTWDNNIFLRMGGACCALIDDGPEYDPPERRFKLATHVQLPGDHGMNVYFSPDGIVWRGCEGNPVLPYHPEAFRTEGPEGDRLIRESVGDFIDTYWDPLQRRYVGCVKVWPTRSEIPEEVTGKEDVTGGFPRHVGMVTSTDHMEWVGPKRILVPDPDKPQEEFYGLSAGVRGQLYIGVLRILRDDLVASETVRMDDSFWQVDKGWEIDGRNGGIGWSELAISHDGEQWERIRDPILMDRNPEPRWDHAVVWGNYPVYVGDEMFFYFGGYSHGHKVANRKIGGRVQGMARMRQDGYLSFDAGEEEGRLCTPVSELHGEGLKLNVSADRGEVRMRVRDESGKVIPGYDFGDCRPIREDSVRAAVKWNRDLGDLKGQKLKLEFSLQQAELYAFHIV